MKHFNMNIDKHYRVELIHKHINEDENFESMFKQSFDNLIED